MNKTVKVKKKMNMRTFAGRVFYLKEMEGDYSCSIKMKRSTNEST